ncbi:sporulation protein [Terrilactibacillus sp. BCM23-1]|uniref:Sporulation protein n=1 Tax=Terrilactibacillus tamarindi TaxID=2599694 RepID=A0A6N8CRW5_9BACI|nr:Spo0B C-terminal domain-containing protein [Terrilactibacillus tamarindi]MTT32420.1 sporulation protein [Terrilactibacillus tamarindi]
MINEKKLIDYFRHMRHDWLNDVQLIKGYLSLENYHEVDRIIDQIITKAKNESKLSNLQVPILTTYIMTYNWLDHHLHLSFQVIGRNDNDLSKYDRKMVQVIKKTLRQFDKHVLKYKDNRMFLTFDVSQKKPIIIFDFTGEIENVKVIENSIHSSEMYGLVRFVEHYINETKANIVLELE